ncbi:hypothetical protein SARC_10839 [Sphaeroforma arctica JP610]|uniref:RPAP1/MINIYO-like TPR repeats domain-containing protein n=1 Tax=Sphaeroforma arctica JP610 TaxID=667725 RepID=A0A0L0FIS5_9EUKA|nr:hypothetical protein SARC_10839 [Sphaeroforma arctica JP610]KNC76674.1 hypothetical protein SARC_10839 [Sphaeroforma arctica JP610]|eukprot:XP_014150576.1 hypothetical protein SARC_10839 [Sphaeroforma arctica JP610]
MKLISVLGSRLSPRAYYVLRNSARSTVTPILNYAPHTPRYSTGAALPLPPARLQCLSGVFTLVQAACVNAIAAYHERAQTRADKEHTPSKGHTQGTEEPADEEDDVNTCQPQHVLGFLSPLLQLFNTITERFRLGPSAIRYVDLNFYGTLAHTTASLYHLYVLTHTPTPRPASPHTSPDANIHTMNGAHASTANSRSQHADSHTTLSSSTHHLLSRVLMGQYAAAVLAALSMPLTRALLCDDMHVHAHTRSADGARKHTHSESDLSSTASAKPTDTRPAQERSSATTPTTTATDTGADNGTVQPTYEDVVAEHSARRKQRDTAHVHDAAQAVRWNYLGALLRCGESLVRVRHGGVVSTREGVNADSTPETARETRACSGTGEEVNGHPDEDPDGGHDTGARKETAETGAGAVEDRLWQALAVGGGANAPNERATGQDSAAQYATPPDNPQACSSPQANTATCHQATGHAHTHTRAPSGSARISLCNALLWYDVLLRRTLSVKASSVRVRASRRHAVCTHLSLMTLLLAHRRRPYPLPSTHVAPSQLHSRYASQSRCACVGFCSRDYTTSLAVHRRAMALVGECGDLFTAEVVQTLSHVALSQDYLGVLTSRSSSCVPVCVRGQAEAKDWRGERKPDARDARVGAQGAAGLQGFDVVSKRVPWQVTDVIRAANAQLKGRATVGAANTSTCVNETPCTGAAQPSTCGGPDETPILGEGVELAGEGAGTWPEGLLGLYLQQIVPEVVEQERDSVHVRDVSSVAFLEMRYLACMYPRTYATHAHTPPNGNGAGGGATARAGAKKARNENAPEKRRLPLSNDWVLLPLMACYDHYIATEKASIRNHKHTSANTDMQHKGQRDIRGMSAGDAIEEESELTDAQTYAMVLEKTATLLLVTEYSHGSINSQIVQEGEAQTQVTRAQTQVQTKPKEEDGVTDATRVGVSVVNEYKLARLMTVFLTSAELFTSPAVAQLLETLLVLCVRQAKVENEMAGRGKGHVHLDFDCLPDIKFYDLYNAFVHQYSSVSLGNTLFQRYLWLPLQQCGPTPLRTLVWGQCVDAMAVMTNFTPDDLPLALETYLYPLETYTPLLTLYLRAIMSGTVRKSRAPVPYHIAIHHLAGLLWGSGDDTPIPDHVPEAPQTETEKMQNQLLTFMSTQRNQESVHDLLAYFYEGPSAFASTSYRPEPPQRVKMLEKFMKTYTKTAT